MHTEKNLKSVVTTIGIIKTTYKYTSKIIIFPVQYSLFSLGSLTAFTDKFETCATQLPA